MDEDKQVWLAIYCAKIAAGKGNAIASKYTDIGLERYKARCGI